MRNVTLKHLRVLAAVARTGSVTAAARELNVTPPAVSLQLQSLEELAGLPLLQRIHNRYQPTPAGQEVLALARRIELSIGDCAEALKLLSGLDGGRVSVGVVSTAKYFAPRALGAFADGHPNVELRLVVGNRHLIFSRLADYELDVAVGGTPPTAFEVESQAIGPHPFVLIGPPDHPLARRRRLVFADFTEETVLLREPGSGTRVLLERLFRDAGVDIRRRLEMGSNETIKQAVIGGFGVALISAHTVAAEVRDGRVITFDVDGLPAVRTWYVMKRRDKRLFPAATALWQFLAVRGAEFLPDTTHVTRSGGPLPS